MLKHLGKFMEFLPNSVDSLDSLVVEGRDVVNAKRYDNLIQMYKVCVLCIFFSNN